MLHKIDFPVLFAQKLRMTLIKEDKERHFQNSLKSLVSYDRKLELGTQSITIDRVFKLLQPQKVTIQYQTTFENNAMYSYRMY